MTTWWFQSISKKYSSRWIISPGIGVWNHHQDQYISEQPGTLHKSWLLKTLGSWSTRSVRVPLLRGLIGGLYTKEELVIILGTLTGKRDRNEGKLLFTALSPDASVWYCCTCGKSALATWSCFHWLWSMITRINKDIFLTNSPKQKQQESLETSHSKMSLNHHKLMKDPIDPLELFAKLLRSRPPWEVAYCSALLQGRLSWSKSSMFGEWHLLGCPKKLVNVSKWVISPTCKWGILGLYCNPLILTFC